MGASVKVLMLLMSPVVVFVCLFFLEPVPPRWCWRCSRDEEKRQTHDPFDGRLVFLPLDPQMNKRVWRQRSSMQTSKQKMPSDISASTRPQAKGLAGHHRRVIFVSFLLRSFRLAEPLIEARLLFWARAVTAGATKGTVVALSLCTGRTSFSGGLSESCLISWPP